MLQIQPVHRRFFFPHPLAYPWLWRKRVVGYRYFLAGLEVDPFFQTSDSSVALVCLESGSFTRALERGAPK